MPRWPIVLAAGRGLPLLPFALVTAVVGGMVFQSRLQPVRYVPIEIPSTAGSMPGAAPQESVPPPVVATAPRALPTESVPTMNSPPSSETSVATAAEGVRATEKWADRLPRESGIADNVGAGNLVPHLKQKQPSAVTSLLANIMASLKHLHATASAPVKVPAARNLKSAPNRLKAEPPHVAMAAAVNPHLAGWTLGGPIAPRAVLGGPVPVGARFAPSLNGATLASRH
jgi:hypothetical protein